MYCKHCGSQIAGNSVFCSKCGKLVIDAQSPSVSTYEQSEVNHPNAKIETGWISTKNFRWKAPTLARVLQCVALVVLWFWAGYGFVCLINGGELDWWTMRGGREMVLVIDDPLGVLRIKRATQIQREWSSIWLYDGFSREEVEHTELMFRLKALILGVLTALTALWFTMKWIKRTPFPKEADGLPRDFADKIEDYELLGFRKHQYVLFVKDGKKGIIDASYYRVAIPAIYDNIEWRTPNKTIDVTLGEKQETLSIAQLLQNNPNNN